MLDDIEAFKCLMYGYPGHKCIDIVRGIILRKMVGENDQLTTKSKVDLSYLPPCLQRAREAPSCNLQASRYSALLVAKAI